MNRTKKIVSDYQTKIKFRFKIIVFSKKEKGVHLESVSYFSILVLKSRCSLEDLCLNLYTIFAIDHCRFPKISDGAQIFYIAARKIKICPNFGNLGGNFPLPFPRQVRL